VVAVAEPATADGEPPAVAARTSAREQRTASGAQPANGADRNAAAAAANGAERAAQSRSNAASAFKAGAAKAGFEPGPDAALGARIGRVIWVAGPLVWGLIEEEAASTVEIGAVVRLQGTNARTFGVITTLKSDGRRGGEDDRRLIEIRLLGEILNVGSHRWRFQRGVSSHPALDGAIHTASREELCAIYARPEAPTVRLGTLKHAADLPRSRSPTTCSASTSRCSAPRAPANPAR
jgi:hypothetical protein